MEELYHYLRILIGKNAGIIFLCVIGAVLNSVMLYLLLSKKQVRSSVHTVYMVQIALTDLLVCFVWMILASVETHHLLQITADTPIPEDTHNDSSVYDLLVKEENASATPYRTWRIMFYWYNFHYYTNILLLASMSVERCAAVWKSMRCQRYQYNRKIIIGVSVLMWIMAFAFVLPNLINPDLIVTDSDSTESVERTFSPEDAPGINSNKSDIEISLSRVLGNIQPSEGDAGRENNTLGALRSFEDVEEKNYARDLDAIYACYKLLAQTNVDDEFVVSRGDLKVGDCTAKLMIVTLEYSEGSGDSTTPEYTSADYEGMDTGWFDDLDGLDLDEQYDPDDEGEALPDPSLFEIRNKTTGETIGIHRGMYELLLIDAVKAIGEHHNKYRIPRHRACDPHISDAARIYVLVVNLVFGFFIPFAIIVFSYVSIAYMIGKRARSRMQPDVSETSTTRFAQQYIQSNYSTTNVPINMRRHSRITRDSMSRRMSDFMRSVILRKHNGENRSFLTDSDREVTPYDSRNNLRYSVPSRQYEELSGEHAKSDNAVRYRPPPKTIDDEKSSEEDPLYDPELQEAIRQLNAVRLRHSGQEEITPKANPRIKKYSFGEAANDNIPQTIEEHPHEIEGEDDEGCYLTASNGSCHTDSTSPTMRNHAALLLVQRNSRRESGGSYGSSMDSMATDQTSLMTSHHDKRYSAATTTSALTPPTPVEPSNPNSNQFFPTSDEKAAYLRTQSAEAGYPLLADQGEGCSNLEQRYGRQQKPGSQLNDITMKLYRKSLQKKQFDDVDSDNIAQLKEDDNKGLYEPRTQLVPGTSAVGGPAVQPRERYSYPHMTRSKSVPDSKLSSGKTPSKSTTRLESDQRRHHKEEEPRAIVSQNPKYNRQNSSSSAVYSRPRTYSTASRGSAGVGTMQKTMARKNAERHLRVSRTVLAYVIVFSICWLPQRITYLLYIIEALVGAPNDVCWRLISGVRVLSFISVLLNPAVYILTQRDFKVYVRNSTLGRRIRRWYAKCSRPRPIRDDSNMDSRRPASSNRNGDVELQGRRVPEDPEISANNNWPGARSAYRMTSPQRSAVRKSPVGGTPEMFPVQNGINIIKHDTTIDEMKEEEAAAEESLEKEMRRRASEEDKQLRDKNRNFLESSDDDVLSAKTTSGSGNKTTSSSSKSESLEQFWMRFLQSGGADLLSPPNGSPETPNNVEPGFPDLEQLGKGQFPNNNVNKVLNDPVVME